MSKALKIAAVVVGVAAIVVTGGIALFGAPAVAGFLGIGASGVLGLGISVTALGSILTVTSAVLGLAAGVLAKPPKGLGSSSGTQLDFIADPAAGEPYVIGDAMVGMDIVHQASWGDKNKFLGLVGILSCAGPIMAYDGFYADMTQITFSGTSATGYYSGYMYLDSHAIGDRPGSAVWMGAPDGSSMPDWNNAAGDHRTSGLASAGLILVADIDNGKIYSGGAPKMTHRIRGVKAYDPRADSTQTGGSGTQRALNEATYVYSENPWVHAATFALGRWVNGVRVMGPGLPPDKIDFAAFMEAANVADANGWKASGRVMSTDGKWDALKAIAQAGGGYPMPTAAHLSCLVNTPKVSLATISETDLKGTVSAPQMFTRRSRINGAIPRYRSASHGWEIVPATAVRNSTYLAADGGKEATREIEFALVADKGDGNGLKQAAQLAAYEVANSRERGPISVELGYYWSQYKLGDCLTLNLPSANLVNQKCVVIGRTVNPARNTITLEFRTEDDAKHSWALGQTGTAPPPTTVVQPPGTGDTGGETTVEITTLIQNSYSTGMTFSISDTPAVTISNHTCVYADKSVAVTGTGGTPHAVPGAVTGDRIYIYYDDPARAGGAVVYQHIKLPASGGDASAAFASVNYPYRHFVCTGLVPASGGTTTGGSDAGSGGGGGGPCVTTDTPILMADGSSRPAGDLRPGDVVRTQHEHGLEWGDYPISALRIVDDQPLFRADVDGQVLRGTGDHRIWVGGQWRRLREIGERDGTGAVVKMTVWSAHTYVSNGILSHNMKMGDL